jgi:hypothetical protein
MFELSLNPPLLWDGRKGSLAKFGCSVGFVRFANVPCSEGTGIICFFYILTYFIKTSIRIFLKKSTELFEA